MPIAAITNWNPMLLQKVWKHAQNIQNMEIVQVRKMEFEEQDVNEDLLRTENTQFVKVAFAKALTATAFPPCMPH
jgi:hypothetical protein